jgi:hypothetical protein
VPVEHSAEHERRDGERLLVRVAHDEIEAEATETIVGGRPAPVVGDAMYEQWMSRAVMVQ